MLFTFLEGFEHESFVIREKEEARGLTAAREEIVNCLDIVEGNEGFEHKVF